MFELGSSNSRHAAIRGRVVCGSSLREDNDMCASLTLDEALARGEVLAANTTEATHVIRVGDWVYKFLKPFEQTAFQTAADRRRQIRLRVRASHIHAELNPLEFDERHRCLVSRFIAGREATPEESCAAAMSFKRSRRGYIQDVGGPNTRLDGDRFVVVDFVLIEHHWDWIQRKTTSLCSKEK